MQKNAVEIFELDNFQPITSWSWWAFNQSGKWTVEQTSKSSITTIFIISESAAQRLFWWLLSRKNCYLDIDLDVSRRFSSWSVSRASWSPWPSSFGTGSSNPSWSSSSPAWTTPPATRLQRLMQLQLRNAPFPGRSPQQLQLGPAVQQPRQQRRQRGEGRIAKKTTERFYQSPESMMEEISVKYIVEYIYCNFCN